MTRVATVWSRRELSDTRAADDASALCGGGGHLGDAVLLVGVELTVVGQEPERLRHRQVWIGIRGEPGVEEERVHRVIGVGQVGEVADHLGRGEPPLEYLGASRQRQRIQTGQGRFGCNRSPRCAAGPAARADRGRRDSEWVRVRRTPTAGSAAALRRLRGAAPELFTGTSRTAGRRIPLCHCRFDQTLGPCLLTRRGKKLPTQNRPRTGPRYR